jgi:fructosamine-3-kinase
MALPTGVLTALAGDGYRLDNRAVEPVAGGINACFRVSTREGQPFFLKTNAASTLEMFRAEQEGLLELRSAGAVRVPEPLAVGATAGTAYLLLEFIEMDGARPRAGAALGELLARQHRVTAPQFGWHRDNTIGTNPQRNPATTDWAGFWGEHRLGYQLRLASERGFAAELGERGERLLAAIPVLLAGHSPPPSLLHGDLWGGNWGVTPAGQPVIFDPAVYYGDREADIAMTELFGGFPRSFHDAYRASWPLAPGYEVRRHLYNLYHVLNHLNLFGSAYLRQSVSLLDRLLGDLQQRP